MTTPAAPAAGVHLPWARVPSAVQAWAAGLGGGDPVSVRDLPGGFSPGATSVLEWPRRAVFVKAVGPELNPESPDFHRREAAISAALPVTPHLDRLAELESGWPEACLGTTLVHGDVRADNVLLADDRVVFVDWPHAAVGNPAFDAVAWAPSVVLEGGPDRSSCWRGTSRRPGPTPTR